MLAVLLEDSKGEYVSMQSSLEVLKTDSVSTYCDVVVKGKPGKRGVLRDDLDVQRGAVLHGEGCIVQLAEDVYIFVIDLPCRDFQNLL